MSARIESLAPGSSPDAAVNGIIDFAKNGFGDTQMFGLLARRPELLKRAAPMFAYFLAGQGGLIEPPLLELMRLRGGESQCLHLLCHRSVAACDKRRQAERAEPGTP